MNTLPDLPRLLTLTDLDRAVEIQASAFIDDPLWCYLFPSQTRRASTLRKVFRPAYTFSIRNQQAYGVSDPMEGVAVWSVPRQKVAPSALFRAGFERLLLSSFVWQIFKVGGIFRRFEEMQKKYAPEPHYYLNTISVAPTAQGKGLASKLIKPFLARADAQQVSVYTETMTPANVTLYEHYGFRCMEHYRVPNTGLNLWAFYRAVQR